MFGVSFLSPLFLIGAIAAAVPILLHLFHRKTEVVINFPAVQLLTRVPVQQHRRRRLRELLLLALRVAALVLLAVSFARPYVGGAGAADSSPITVVAVDTSMSLSAPNQFDRAQEAARHAVDAAPPSHAIAVVAFADAAAVAVEPTTDRSAARAAIAKLSPGPFGTRYRTALSRASEVIGARDARLVMITDLQQAGWDANDEGGLPDGTAVEIVSVAPPAANLAVTFAERRDGRVLVSVQNYGNLETRTTARLIVEGKELATAAVTVAPLASADVALMASLPRSGRAEIRIDDQAGYQLDNVRQFLLDPPSAVPIAVVVADPTGSTGGLYLERALDVASAGREFRVEVLGVCGVARLAQDDLNCRAAVFVLGTRTLDRAGRDRLKTYIAGGGQLFVALGPDVDAGTIGDVVGVNLSLAEAPVRTPGATLVASDGRHPIFRPFLNPSGALGDVQVEQYRRLNDHPDRTVLARFSGGDPALTEQQVGEGRLMIYTSDLDNQWSRFPLNPAFVPFAVETARYLSRGQEPPGENLGNVDVRESNPATVTVAAFTNAIERTNRAALVEAGSAARDIEEQQRWWQIGLFVMLLALAGEGLIGRRAT